MSAFRTVQLKDAHTTRAPSPARPMENRSCTSRQPRLTSPVGTQQCLPETPRYLRRSMDAAAPAQAPGRAGYPAQGCHLGCSRIRSAGGKVRCSSVPPGRAYFPAGAPALSGSASWKPCRRRGDQAGSIRPAPWPRLCPPGVMVLPYHKPALRGPGVRALSWPMPVQIWPPGLRFRIAELDCNTTRISRHPGVERRFPWLIRVPCRA